MNTLEYKGYKGSVEYSPDDHCLFGNVLGMGRKIMITYEGETVKELEIDFKNAIDHYLQSCKENNKKPKKPYSGTINIRLTPLLHARVSELANDANMSVNAFVKQTLQEAIS